MLRLIVLLAGLVWTSQAMAAKVALVIGNSAYENTGALPNPRNDADAFGAFLAASGFAVTTVTDATRAEMSAALSAFAQSLTPDDTALFYYAGHGLQMSGENYLVGVEARLQNEFDVPGETVALSSIIEIMEAKAKVSMLFIDACRNNPLAQSLAREATRAITSGLAPVEVHGDGTMIAFAATPGQVAYDGPAGNSPFTKALMAHLATPGLEVGTAFKRVIAEVRAATGDRQSPQLVSNLSTEVYFAPQDAPAAAPAVDVAALDYEKAERLGTPRGWQLFLDKHPDGFLADLARTALETLLGTRFEDPTLTPQQAEESLALTREVRTEIQIALVGLGYDLGAPDGLFGPATRRNIARYQAAANLQETGYVNVAMLNKLGIGLAVDGGGLVSADEARYYNPADLTGLEDDSRLIAAIACLQDDEVSYGFFEGHLYLAILSGYVDVSTARSKAVACGGDLVTISSAEENDFVFSLVKNDDRFFKVNFPSDAPPSTAGPMIGLTQDPAGREPRGGWAWTSGQAVTYTNWVDNEPNEIGRNEDIAVFMAHDQYHLAKPGAPWRVDAATWGDVTNADSYIIEIN